MNNLFTIVSGAFPETPLRPSNLIAWMIGFFIAVSTGLLRDGRIKYKKALEELERTHAELKNATEKIKVLSGLLPICASCKNIRNPEGHWENIESYINTHSEAEFSHGLCPECSEEIYGHETWYVKMRKENG